MTFLVLDGLSKRFGEYVAVDKLSLVVEKGEFVSLLGPSGCGKTTDPADDRRLPGADIGRDHAREAQSGRRHAGPARSRHRVPELCPLPAHDRGRERRLRARDAESRAGGARRACAADAGAGRAGGLRGPLSAPHVGRPAAACRAGARARHPSAHSAARRAAVEPGCQAARGDADRAAPDPAHARHHHAARHPRPVGGDGAVRPHCRHEPGPGRADRQAARGLRAAGDGVRGPLPRQDQHARGHRRG